MLLKTRLLISVAAIAAVSPAIAPATAQSISSFTEGDVVVSVEGDGGNTGSYTDNQAAPLSLYEFGSSGTGFVGSLVLPQTNSAPISPSPANMARRRKEPCSSPATAAT